MLNKHSICRFIRLLLRSYIRLGDQIFLLVLRNGCSDVFLLFHSLVTLYHTKGNKTVTLIFYSLL